MITKQRVRNSGFTLIEVVLFIAVFTTSIILIFASVNYAALGLKNAQLKIVATHASEQLSEWLTYQEDSQGYIFMLSKASPTGLTYCFNDSTPVWSAAASCTDFSLNGLYKRELFLQSANSDLQVTATITTSWNSLGFIRNSQIIVLFTNHQ